MSDTSLSSPIGIHVLASGSKGNASIIECGGRSILVDCGICKRDFFARCEESGVDVSSIEAVLVTHEHTDHTKGLGVVMRGLAQQGIQPMLITSEAIRGASREIRALQDSCDLRAMRNEDVLSLAGMQVVVFGTSHDAAESFGFRFQSPDDALGFMTDTGVVTPIAHELLRNLRTLALESNHDVVMLKNGDYPYSLKQRVAGQFGHLSNEQSAEELQALLSDRLEQIIAMHISENNNRFGLAVESLQEVITRNTHSATVTAGLPRTPQSFF